MTRKARTNRSLPRRRAMTPEDLLRFHGVSEPRISPDGSHIVFVKKHVGGKNEYVSNLWLVPTAAGKPRQFTSGVQDRSPRWSPDGALIAFVRGGKDVAPQLHLIDVAGGEARLLTRLPEGFIGDHRWAPNGRALALSFRQQDPEWTKEARKAREENGASLPPRVLEDWWYRLDGDGYFNAQRFRLFLVDAESGEHKKIYDRDTLGFFSWDFSTKSMFIFRYLWSE